MGKSGAYGRRLVSEALTAGGAVARTEAATLLLQFVLGIIGPVSGAPADEFAQIASGARRVRERR